MPDITMCKGEGCELREGCYRCKAKPGPFAQSYFIAPPIDDGECEYFDPVRVGDNLHGSEED